MAAPVKLINSGYPQSIRIYGDDPNNQTSAVTTDGNGNLNVNVNGSSQSNPIVVEITDGANTPLGTAAHPIRVDPTGTTVQPVNVVSGGGSNASVGLTGTTAPTSATEIGTVDGSGNLLNVTGLTLGSTKAATVAIVDGSGSQITSFGGGTQYATGSAQATPVGTVALGWDATNVRALLASTTGQLHVLADSGSTTAVTGIVEVAPTTAANTLSNPFFNVLADNSGHALTVNSTTITSKFALDENIISILGTAPTTAGFLDIKGADGNVFVRQTTGTNLHVVTDTTSTTAVTQATASSLNATVVGTLTNNNAAPAGTNVGALTALANAATPSFSEGDQVLVSVDLSGHQRVVATGAAASGAAVAGNPVLIGGKSGANVASVGVDANGTLSTTSESNGADGQSNTLMGRLYSSGDVAYPFLGVYPLTFNGSTWDRVRSAGVGNAVAATGLGAQVAYVQYNTTLPAPTATQYTAAQCDTTGSTYVNIEGRKATYSAFASFTAVAGDIAVLPGSASKTIRVIRVEISFTTSGTAAIEAVQLIVRSAADTSGTSAAMTAVPHDSNFAGASAAPLRYTVAPTPGAAVGTIRGVQFNDASSTLPGANSWIWDFGSRPSSAIVLRGVAQMICVNLPTAIATQTATVSFEWTEE